MKEWDKMMDALKRREIILEHWYFGFMSTHNEFCIKVQTNISFKLSKDMIFYFSVWSSLLGCFLLRPNGCGRGSWAVVTQYFVMPPTLPCVIPRSA